MTTNSIVFFRVYGVVCNNILALVCVYCINNKMATGSGKLSRV